MTTLVALARQSALSLLMYLAARVSNVVLSVPNTRMMYVHDRQDRTTLFLAGSMATNIVLNLTLAGSGRNSAGGPGPDPPDDGRLSLAWQKEPLTEMLEEGKRWHKRLACW